MEREQLHRHTRERVKPTPKDRDTEQLTPQSADELVARNALKKIDVRVRNQLILLEQAAEAGDDVLYQERREEVLRQIETLIQTTKPLWDKETILDPYLLALARIEEKASNGGKTTPFDEAFFKDFPKAREALAGRFNVGDENVSLSFEKQEGDRMEELPITGEADTILVPTSGVRKVRDSFSERKDYALKGWEKSLGNGLIEVQVFFEEWLRECGITLEEYEGLKAFDANQNFRLPKGFPEKYAALSESPLLSLFERFKALREGLQQENAEQVRLVLDRVEAQLQLMSKRIQEKIQRKSKGVFATSIDEKIVQSFSMVTRGVETLLKTRMTQGEVREQKRAA